jgi:predicted ester cyclase
MKGTLLIVSIVTVLFSMTAVWEKAIATDSTEHNRSVVLRYFKEVLDGKKIGLLDELFTIDVIMHRPEGKLSNLDQAKMSLGFGLSFVTLETTIHDIIASDNRVVVRLSHTAVYTEGAYMRSRLGMHKVGGKILMWDAIAIFRLKDGKIAEEWVQLDDLGKLMQLGTVSLSSP